MNEINQQFWSRSLHVDKAYERKRKAYSFDAKTAAGREKRIAWIADRMNKN